MFSQTTQPFWYNKSYTYFAACCLLFTALLLITGCDNNKDNSKKVSKSYHQMFVPGIIDVKLDNLKNFYASIKGTELSEHSEALLKIVEKRNVCYLGADSIRKRVSDCKKQYQIDIVNYVKKNINSPPDFGKFIYCTETCPAVSAICKGETEGTCSEHEVQCIEYCLDEFWRGYTIFQSTIYEARK